MELHWRSAAVARYVEEPDLPADVSPRPYLHPVRTLGGIQVTEFMPPDHRHHFGVNVAIPDVGGHNFWGGRTFVRDRGPTWLANHGRQQHREWTDDGTELLSWIGADGGEVLRERRTLVVRGVEDGWALDLRFALTNVSGAPLAIGSPATNGRPGAGYGGFFWRTSGAAGSVRPFGPGVDGEEAVHGCRAPWVAMAGDGWTLVFVAGDARTREDPWFVRAAEYPGVGSSLAWDSPLTVLAGGVVARRIVTLVLDGVVPSGRAVDLAAETIEHLVEESARKLRRGAGARLRPHPGGTRRTGAVGLGVTDCRMLAPLSSVKRPTPQSVGTGQTSRHGVHGAGGG